MVASSETQRRSETYRFTFDLTGPILSAQKISRTIDQLTTGDVARTLIDPSLGLILHDDVLKNLGGEGVWDNVQRLRLLETEFGHIQRTIENRGLGGTSAMVGICFGRKVRAEVDFGRLLSVRFVPIIAEVAIAASVAPVVLVGLLRVWQQAGLAKSGANQSRQYVQAIGQGPAGELDRLTTTLEEIDVIGPSTAKSLSQFTQPLGAPQLRSIVRLAGS